MSGERTLATELATWAARLTYADLPTRITDYAVSAVISHLGVLRAGISHPLGWKLLKAFGSPLADDPARAAHVLAGLSSCLYYEDSMYVGHVTHSTVNVPLAYRRQSGLDGRALLAAVVASSECAARVTAAAALGTLRGQGASYAQLVGAVAARSHAQGDPVEAWVNAWGIALSAPPWPLRRAFLGSDAKVLSAAVPVRIALDACDAAAAGLTGAPDLLEHPNGLLAKVSQVPSPEVITSGFGERWHTETLTVKLHPAGAYVDAAIDCAMALHDKLTAQDADDIAEVEVRAAGLTIAMDADGAPYLDRERSAIMALNLSVGYNVATALLTGAVTPADLTGPATADPRRWELAERTRLRFDPELSRNLLRATAPLGEAVRQAGERARGWLADFSGGRAAPPPGPPSTTFENATKAVGAVVTLVFKDGRRLTEGRAHAAGSAGEETRREHRAMARAKLLATGVPQEVADELDRLPELDARQLDHLIRTALTAH
ncbi:MmgE/PrpD family protein [Lentzea sp. NPDC042327]|uniref:MmgE/PrpD family protein n=1 Tax=Lentzea sp. NPDC042327 TaxID=3154801 RepID=UPI0033E8B44B